MLRQKKTQNPNAGHRRPVRPQTEFVSDKANWFMYGRYSRPLSSIFPESLHRCLKELNEKQYASAATKFNSRPATRFYVSPNPQDGSEMRNLNAKKALTPSPQKRKIFGLVGATSKADLRTAPITSSQWYIPASTSVSEPTSLIRPEEPGMGNVCGNSKSIRRPTEGKRLDHWSHMAKSLPSLLDPFQALRVETPDNGPLDKDVDGVLDVDSCSDDDSESSMKQERQMPDPRVSIVSNTGTIYDEPWDSEKVADKWMRIMDTLQEGDNAVTS